MQKLNFEQIKELVHGVALVEEGDNGISFFRFTKEQQELYKNKSPEDFYIKTFATAGVSLEFLTDSKNLTLKVSVSKGSSRSFFTHSIYVDDKRADELSGDIGAQNNVLFEKTFELNSGMKKVKIIFPWSVQSNLVSLEIDDNAKISPVSKNYKLLMFGDSITQGYDAYIPENNYAVSIANKLNASAINKGIAGEQFFSDLASLKDDFEPDLITVAYGTNDWRHTTKEKFQTECKGFFENLRILYPKTEIIAISPLWRTDIDEKQEFGEPLSFISDYIKLISQSISNMTVIDGINLVPHKTDCYQTDGLHPIDKGYKYYADNLWNILIDRGLISDLI